MSNKYGLLSLARHFRSFSAVPSSRRIPHTSTYHRDKLHEPQCQPGYASVKGGTMGSPAVPYLVEVGIREARTLGFDGLCRGRDSAAAGCF